MYDLIVQVLSAAFNLALPFGFSFGMLCVFIWSLPIIVRLINRIF